MMKREILWVSPCEYLPMYGVRLLFVLKGHVNVGKEEADQSRIFTGHLERSWDDKEVFRNDDYESYYTKGAYPANDVERWAYV